VILLFIFTTFSYIDTKNWQPFIPAPTSTNPYGIIGILRGSTAVFFAYIGFDAVAACAQEVKNPSRDMPIGILGSLVICTALYIMMFVFSPPATLNLNAASHFPKAIPKHH
jgi:APA family basic amino acid/polyamine antiporter